MKTLFQKQDFWGYDIRYPVDMVPLSSVVPAAQVAEYLITTPPTGCLAHTAEDEITSPSAFLVDLMAKRDPFPPRPVAEGDKEMNPFPPAVFVAQAAGEVAPHLPAAPVGQVTKNMNPSSSAVSRACLPKATFGAAPEAVCGIECKWPTKETVKKFLNVQAEEFMPRVSTGIQLCWDGMIYPQPSEYVFVKS
jgi:hypothetical protein